MSQALLKFQIGPVQDFIAQARSTRDLWSGSYLLSWLVAAGIKALPQGSNLIFPARDDQPLLSEQLNPNTKGILIPNLPNIFIASINGDAVAVADEIKKAIEGEWQRMAKAVWDGRDKIGLPDKAKDRFDAQVHRHLTISWQATELTGDYADAYRHNGWQLDAVRQTRDFQAWDSAIGLHEKDSLSGKDEALIAGNDIKGEWKFLFKHADYLGAITVIKRVWHLAYLKKEPHHLKTDSREFEIRSIPAIAARSTELDDDASPQEKALGEKYIAAIAFDGDAIGKWVNGDFLVAKNGLQQHHPDFSRALSHFALGKVREIVEREVDGTDKQNKPIRVPCGQLIYAGGDDVVCLVPADAALEVASELRRAFCKATNHINGADPKTGEPVKPDASAGIAIAHIHSPLQDLIREAQKAEKRAKNSVGRPAFSISLMKRSGEISHWGSKWESLGLELYQAIAGELKPGGLSAKFPHRVCQLLTPYLTQTTDLSKQQDAITDSDIAIDLITREFAHAAERQGSKALADKLEKPLRDYLNNLPQDTKTLFTSIIGLCTTVAFADRTKPTAAEKQTAA